MPRDQNNAHLNTPRSVNGEVLVAIVNHPHDLVIARDRHWYRIPVSSADKWLRHRWPPQWLAFYQPKVFGAEAFSIRYYARIVEVRRVFRKELFPEELTHPKANHQYYQLMLGSIEQLPKPIPSRRRRRLVFIPTTWRKVSNAVEINDLYDDSPLEDLLWTHLKRLDLTAERQEFIQANGRDYALDFALYCTTGKVDVEADGDTWHADLARIPEDNRRDNDIETSGWKLLRFNTSHLREQMVNYCLPTIIENVRLLGGMAEDRLVPRDIQLDPSARVQLSLFDDQIPPRT